MLTLKLFETVKDTLAYGFLGLWAFIDGIVYKLVSIFFKLFYALAEVQLFDNSIYRAIADRVYLFVGIIALFSLSIALLKSLVNPDEINKGVIKSFKSMIMSVALVILTPTIFTYAFSLQAAILDDNIIGKIFQIDLNKYKETGESEIVSSANSMHEICNFDENEEKQVRVQDSSGNTVSGDIEITHNECQGNYITLTVLEAFFSPYSYSVVNTYGTTWEEARKYMVYTGNFDYITTFSKNAYDEAEENSISYSVIISTVGAAFLIYVLLSFSIDLGVRCAKLAFYQLIAPIPVLMKMIPGKDGQFDKWAKAAIATFLEVFVRLIVIEFIIFMCSNLFSIIDSMNGFSSVGLIGKAILAMGLFAFAKQAPKLLGEALGFEAGNLKLGIKNKLHDVPVTGKITDAIYGGANKFKGATTGALGGAWTGLVNGIGIKEGAIIGAGKGFKSGGSQFNKQRQGVYEAFGGKGEAGWFGDRAFLDKKIDQAEKNAKKSFKSQFQDTDEYKQRLQHEIAAQENAKQNAITQAQSSYNDAINAKKFIEDSLNEFKKTDLYKSWRDNSYAQQRVNKMISQGKLNGNDPQAIRAELEKIENAHVSEMAKKFVESGQDTDGKVMSYLSNMDKRAEAQANIDKAQKGLEDARNIQINSEAAQEAVNEYYRTAKASDLSFLGKAYKNEMQSDHLKEYRENNAEQIELYAEAMKKMTKDEDSKSTIKSSDDQGNSSNKS